MLRRRRSLWLIVLVGVATACATKDAMTEATEDIAELGDAPTLSDFGGNAPRGDTKALDTAQDPTRPVDVAHWDSGPPSLDTGGTPADLSGPRDALVPDMAVPDIAVPDIAVPPDVETADTWEDDEPPSEMEERCLTSNGEWDPDGELCACPPGRVWTHVGCVGPESQGPLSWQRNRFDLRLSGGLFGTTLTLRLYIPFGSGPYPVVVFSHGYQLAPNDYRSYAERLASWGYVVVMPQMPGGLTNHKTLKEHLTAVLDWIVADAEDPMGELKGQADKQRLGMAGHSLGGKISMLVASEDSRPDAIFGVDPVDSVGNPLAINPNNWPRVIPDRMSDISIPLAFVGETVDATCSGFACQACAPEGENFVAYYTHAVGPALAIEVLGANHMSFLDDPNCGLVCSLCNDRSDDPAVTRAVTQKYMVAFFELYLREDGAFSDVLVGDAISDDVAGGLVTVEWKNGFGDLE